MNDDTLSRVHQQTGDQDGCKISTFDTKSHGLF